MSKYEKNFPEILIGFGLEWILSHRFMLIPVLRYRGFIEGMYESFIAYDYFITINYKISKRIYRQVNLNYCTIEQYFLGSIGLIITI